MKTCDFFFGDFEEDIPARRLGEFQNGPPGRGLSTPALSDETEHFPLPDVERDSVHCLRPLPAGAEDLTKEPFPERIPHAKIPHSNHRAGRGLVRSDTSGTWG